MQISIRDNFPQVVAEMDRLGQAVGEKVLARALNASVDQGKTRMAQQISREFRISSTEVKSRLSVTRAKTKGGYRFEASLEASNRGKGRSMNLIAFVEKVVTLAQARKRVRAGEGQATRGNRALQLRFQIKREGGKKVIPGAFIANKGRTVFIREGKSRLPIKALNTIDVAQMFNTQRINKVVVEVMLSRFEAQFQRELRAVVGGFAK